MSLRPSSTSQSSLTHSRPATRKLRTETRHSRPATGRPVTAASTRYEGSYVIAVLESRGIGREVGIAAFNKDTGQAYLVQISDCPTYVKTLHHMHLHYPSLILVPDTSFSALESSVPSSKNRPLSTSLLVQCIQDEFIGVPMESVLRKYWNEEGGLQFVNQLSVDNDDRAATLLASSSKYYTLSAVCALFKHLEIKLNTRYAAHSLLIRYTPVEGTMLIDNDTARNLELIENMSYKKSSHSLFGVLNHTWTTMAARLLRANLLSPITAQTGIDARLDAVEEVVHAEDKFTSIKDSLRTVNKLDLDKLISQLVTSEARQVNGSKAASQRISQMLLLRSVVENIPLVRDSLQGCLSTLLRVIHEMLSDERVKKIDELIADCLNEDISSLKGGGLNAMNARVYAVKVNHNCLLDVARETYKENVADIFQLNRSLSEQHGLPLQLIHQEQGFIFSLKHSELEEAGKTELPAGFVNINLKKGKWFFESIDLKKRNARMKDALDETLMLSDKIIQNLVSKIIDDIGALYKASEAIALLDMIWSFAHTTILHNYVRPEFTGTLAIKAGRHPILETVQSAGSLVANDVYCCDTSCFQIIQGPNMSGKSTYLRQIGLMTVMAMCGCFVPAEYASFRIHDALLTRLSNDDDIERNLSTFAGEMSSAAMILGLSTSDSLILVDELGRGTSPREGIGISHAIAERLIKIKAYVFFATHFNELCTSLSRQPSVVNLHLSVQKSRPSTSSICWVFHYKIVDGIPEGIDHYGLELARLADLPSSVLREAYKISERLLAIEANHKEDCEGNRIAVRRKALLRLHTQLTQAYEYSALPGQELLTYIGGFQKEIAQILRSNLDDDCSQLLSKPDIQPQQ